MKLWILTFLVIIMIGCSGKKGDTGPTGPRGEQGISGQDGNKNVYFFDTTGILPAPTTSSSGNNYWYIWMPYPIYDDSCLVQTWVRFDSNKVWMPPDTWYYGDQGGVKIMEEGTDMAAKGSQFKINVIYYCDE